MRDQIRPAELLFSPAVAVPFPTFPVEIWFQIMDRACQDDGTTGLSLSGTSKELRRLSELHRYQSIQINGWKQLIAFERRLSQVPKEQQGVLNLFVYLPSTFDAGYPGIPKWAPDEDSEEDASYVPSDDSDKESDGGEEEHVEEWKETPLGEPGDGQPDEVDEDAPGPAPDRVPNIWEEENEIELSPLSEDERVTLVRENEENLRGDRSSLVPELARFEHCEEDARQTYEAEYHIFVTLNRLLT